MHQSSPSNLLLASAGTTLSGKRKTPLDVGNSLFRDLIAREGAWVKGEWGRISFSDQEMNPHGIRQKGEDPLKSLDEKGRYPGLAFSLMRLPGTAAARVVTLLQKQGLSRERIDRLILSATDREGMIRLNRLMAGVAKGKTGDQASEGGPVVRSADIPRVEMMLFQLGFRVGEVKKAIEESRAQEGGLMVDRLSHALGRVFPEAPSQDELAALMEGFGIKSTARGMSQALNDPHILSAFRDLAEGVSMDIQNKIKQEIGQVLRQRGVPPQEVKSFLETLSVGYARSLLKQENPPSRGVGQVTGTGELDAFLKRVVIKSRPEWDQDGWQNKILRILKEENLLVGKGGGIQESQDAATLRPNLGKLLGQPDSAAKIPHPDLISDPAKGGKQETATRQPNTFEIQGDKKSEPTFSLRGNNASGGEFQWSRGVQVRPEAEPGLSGKANDPLPQPLPRVLDRMVWMIQGGEQKGRIRLSPPELGRLDLDLVIRYGHIQANLSAETLAAKELIDQNLNQLKQQLTDQGFFVERFEVTVGLGDRRSSEGEARTGGQRRDRHFKEERKGANLDPVAATPSGGLEISLSQIDVHV